MTKSEREAPEQLGTSNHTDAMQAQPSGARRACAKCRGSRVFSLTPVLLSWLMLVWAPATAAAHGPVAPVATSYQARITKLPAGLKAQVVDGYVRMWLQVPRHQDVTVLDYAGAAYLRFSRAGVQVNSNSAMYYLNQTPVALVPPASLKRSTSPHWQLATTSNAYEWHDGRLQALASVALTPGASYLGRWSIPILVDGRRTAISGALWYADDPPIVWFWPIVVLLVCVLAAVRLPRPRLHAQLARWLGFVALAALATAAVGQELHGRPNVSIGQYLELAVILALVAVWLRSVITGRAGYFLYCVIAFVALWQGLTLISTLLHGFILIALPAFVARAATVLCIACGAALLPLVFQLAETPVRERRQPRRGTRARPDPGVQRDAAGTT
jgi:hypothetical protein